MKITLLTLFAAVALLMTYGCVIVPPDDDDWERKFLHQRGDAEHYVRLAKARLKPGSDQLIEAQRRYQSAKDSVNLLLGGIQDSILDGERPKSSRHYAVREKDASDTLDSFNKYVVDKTLLPEERPKVIPIIGPLIAQMVNIFFDRMNAISARNAQEAKDKRAELASRLNKYRFVEFGDIRP